jgi:DNA-binding XRE family transcriptional regulator
MGCSCGGDGGNDCESAVSSSSSAATVAKNRLVALGLAVIEAREQRGMSASELAEASGIPLRSLERIEAGEPDPDADATTDKMAPDPDSTAFGAWFAPLGSRKA